MAHAARRRRCAPKERIYDPPDWSQLLIDAVTKPGVISTAYTAFWNYSVGNQMLALFECAARGIEPGPIHTFNGWLKIGRHVRKGERAITLCMPVRVRSGSEAVLGAQSILTQDCEHTTHDPPPTTPAKLRFVYRPNWFVLSQTDGEPYIPLIIPAWDERQACHALLIDREPFHHTDGNVQGYAREKCYAVSPIAYLPHRTMFHEIGHILLGHTAEMMGLTDSDERTPKDLREVEAEAVSLICCQSLGLPGEVESRGYLQHWLGSKRIEERSAQRIFHAADQMLRSGRPTPPESTESESDPA